MAARIRTALTFYLFVVLGAFLVAVPWTALWDHATLALVPTPLGGWARSGWIKGAVTGVGALDLLVAWQEAGALWRSLVEPSPQ